MQFSVRVNELENNNRKLEEQNNELENGKNGLRQEMSQMKQTFEENIRQLQTEQQLRFNEVGMGIVYIIFLYVVFLCFFFGQ
jgi:adenosyl cobinamide kinase/adenosyl cobinamide phosphate guanylyltransferase